MKAKVINTGEIVEVYHETQHGQLTNVYKEAVLVNGRMWTEDELDFSINSKANDVDLEKELESWRHNHFHGRRDNEARGEYLERVSQLDMAKHFFELGLNAQNEK